MLQRSGESLISFTAEKKIYIYEDLAYCNSAHSGTYIMRSSFIYSFILITLYSSNSHTTRFITVKSGRWYRLSQLIHTNPLRNYFYSCLPNLSLTLFPYLSLGPDTKCGLDTPAAELLLSVFLWHGRWFGEFVFPSLFRIFMFGFLIRYLLLFFIDERHLLLDF